MKSESKRPRKKKFAAIFYKPIPEEKELAELMEKRSQCVSESSSILSKKKKIKSRLVSIEWKLHAAHAKPQETRSAFRWYSILEGSNLTKLIQEQSQLLSSIENVSPDVCSLCIRLWMYLSKFQELFKIRVTSVNYIFILLKGLDQIAPQMAESDSLSRLSPSSRSFLHYYSTLCITILKIILEDFQNVDDPDDPDNPDDPSASTTPEAPSIPTTPAAPASPSDSGSFPDSLVLASVFKHFDIGERCLSLSTWPELARLLFYGYIADTGLLDSASSLRAELQNALEQVAQKGLVHVDGLTMLRVLLALAEMALDSSQVGETGKLNGRRASGSAKWPRNAGKADGDSGRSGERRRKRRRRNGGRNLNRGNRGNRRNRRNWRNWRNRRKKRKGRSRVEWKGKPGKLKEKMEKPENLKWKRVNPRRKQVRKHRTLHPLLKKPEKLGKPENL